MIFGNINNDRFEQQVATLPKALGDALRFIKTADLVNHETGKFPMDLNGVEVFLQVMDLNTSAREAVYPEIHHKYVDVQYCVSGGPEKHTCFVDDGKNAVRSDELGTERDILFYENDPAKLENAVILAPGDYVIYFPWDVHAPGQNPADASVAFRKIVMKVPVKACV